MKSEPVKWEAQVRRHAQELHKLLVQKPNDAILADVTVKLESAILNNQRFKGTDSAQLAEEIS